MGPLGSHRFRLEGLTTDYNCDDGEENNIIALEMPNYLTVHLPVPEFTIHLNVNFLQKPAKPNITVR